MRALQKRPRGPEAPGSTVWMCVAVAAARVSARFGAPWWTPDDRLAGTIRRSQQGPSYRNLYLGQPLAAPSRANGEPDPANDSRLYPRLITGWMWGSGTSAWRVRNLSRVGSRRGPGFE